MDPRPGALLVASAELLDPHFAGSVVLLLDTDDDGALGVVLTQPTPARLGDVLPGWHGPLGASVVHRGGPVGTDGALGLGRLVDPDAAPPGWRPCFDDVGLVDLDSPVEVVSDALADFRVFAGYAGWSAHQLRDEIAEGSWYVVPSLPGDSFRLDVSHLRRDVLRRQPGSWRGSPHARRTRTRTETRPSLA
ncbi:YqgE/AlgH family protein [Nocardioides alcanivorans]|uniref:YqgE/AlgH family protein n=1 Tax=Nocardioides alcanivorans TaxID=2897352 RepID=UPI001F3015DB|nr:YqgE/AlgH family protein [Nocardioides alcanivorans]